MTNIKVTVRSSRCQGWGCGASALVNTQASLYEARYEARVFTSAGVIGNLFTYYWWEGYQWIERIK